MTCPYCELHSDCCGQPCEKHSLSNSSTESSQALLRVQEAYARGLSEAVVQWNEKCYQVGYRAGRLDGLEDAAKACEYQAEVDEGETGPNWKPDNAKYARCLRRMADEIRELKEAQ